MKTRQYIAPFALWLGVLMGFGAAKADTVTAHFIAPSAAAYLVYANNGAAITVNVAVCNTTTNGADIKLFITSPKLAPTIPPADCYVTHITLPANAYISVVSSSATAAASGTIEISSSP